MHALSATKMNNVTDLMGLKFYKYPSYNSIYIIHPFHVSLFQSDSGFIYKMHDSRIYIGLICSYCVNYTVVNKVIAFIIQDHVCRGYSGGLVCVLFSRSYMLQSHCVSVVCCLCQKLGGL